VILLLAISAAFGHSTSSNSHPSAIIESIHGSVASNEEFFFASASQPRSLSARIIQFFIKQIPTEILQTCKRIETEKSAFPQDFSIESHVARLLQWNGYKVCGETYTHWKWFSTISLDDTLQKGLIEFEQRIRSRNEELRIQLKEIQAWCMQVELELSLFPRDLIIANFQQKFANVSEQQFEACRADFKSRKWTQRSLDIVEDLKALSKEIQTRNKEVRSQLDQVSTACKRIEAELSESEVPQHLKLKKRFLKRQKEWQVCDPNFSWWSTLKNHFPEMMELLQEHEQLIRSRKQKHAHLQELQAAQEMSDWIWRMVEIACFILYGLYYVAYVVFVMLEMVDWIWMMHKITLFIFLNGMVFVAVFNLCCFILKP
jgi:hypothetical protein